MTKVNLMLWFASSSKACEKGCDTVRYTWVFDEWSLRFSGLARLGASCCEMVSWHVHWMVNGLGWRFTEFLVRFL